MNSSVIKVTNLVKEYKMGECTVNAVNDVSFEIPKGDFVVVLGPSGSGKSTLLNIVGGMDKPTAGEVWIEDENISKYTLKQLTIFRREKIGFVFQFYNLLASLTTYENIEIASRISNDPLDIDTILKAVDLEHRKESFPSQMSGGEQQRVAIARAVAKNPAILLCDEPTGALDYNTGKLILKLLYKINKEFNKTVVVITHNAAIADMADRVIKMKSGVIESIKINEHPISPEEVEW